MSASSGESSNRPTVPNLPLIGPGDEWWTRWFADVGVPPDQQPTRRGIRLDSQANEGHAAMAGQGFALLTPFLWRGDVAQGRLVQPFEQTSTAGYAYWLAYPPERRMVPKVKRFREWLLAEMREAQGQANVLESERAAGFLAFREDRRAGETRRQLRRRTTSGSGPENRRSDRRAGRHARRSEPYSDVRKWNPPEDTSVIVTFCSEPSDRTSTASCDTLTRAAREISPGILFTIPHSL